MALSSDQSGLVITLVAPFVHRADLLSFQAASKICHDVAMPELYGALRLPSRAGAGGSRRLYKLLRTLLHNASLRPFVRDLSIIQSPLQEKASGEDYPLDREIPSLSDPDRTELADAIASMGPHWWERWIEALEKEGPADLVLPLLLWHVPNLRNLYLDYPFHAFSPHLRKFMLHVANATPIEHFAALEKVTYAAAPLRLVQEPGVRSFEHIQALFHLPRIREVSIALDWRPFTDWPPALRNGEAPQATSLRALRFERCESDIKALEKLAMASLQLSRLEYTWWCDLDVGAGDCIFRVDAFLDALAPLRDCLTELSLRLDYKCTTFDMGIDPGWYGLQGHFTDFSDFEYLHQLRMPLRLMLPTEMGEQSKLPKLPSSLETLILTEDGFDFDTHMYDTDELLEALKRSFADYRVALPRLQTVNLEVPAHVYGLFLDADTRSKINEAATLIGFKSVTVWTYD